VSTWLALLAAGLVPAALTQLWLQPLLVRLNLAANNLSLRIEVRSGGGEPLRQGRVAAVLWAGWAARVAY
jgi:hypothetical protein